VGQAALRIYSDDYLTSAGLVGFSRLYNYALEHGLIPEDQDWLMIKDHYIEIHQDFLKYIPIIFLRRLLNEHSVAEREAKKLSNSREYVKTTEGEKIIESFSKYLEKVKGAFASQGIKIPKYFSGQSFSQHFEELKNALKLIKHPNQLRELDHIVESFVNLLHEQAINEKLTLNYVKSVILGNLYGQVSFLNVVKNKLSFDETAELMNVDYIQPVLRDLQLHDALNIGNKEMLMNVLENNKDYPAAWKKAVKKMSIEEAINFFNDQLHCMIFDEWIAVGNFEEMVFSPLSVSRDNAVNFTWDLAEKQPRPLSSWGRLVLFMAAIGMTTYSRMINGNYKTYYGFLYSEGGANRQIRGNDIFYQMKQDEKPYEEIITKVLNHEKNRAEYQNANFLFIEINADYGSKKTIMNYFDVPPHMVRYFVANSKGENPLDEIKNRAFREEFLQMVMQGIDPKRLILNHLRQVIRSGYAPKGVYTATKERFKIEKLKANHERSGEELANETKQVQKLYHLGREVREVFVQRSNQRSKVASGDEYVAGGDKRVNAIAYRLLNAASANNKNQFMDGILRLQIQLQSLTNNPLKDLGLFLNVIHEEYLDFPTVANAFISGLLSQRGSQNADEDQQSTAVND
jgi:CRISPR-associated protein Cst1